MGTEFVVQDFKTLQKELWSLVLMSSQTRDFSVPTNAIKLIGDLGPRPGHASW